VYRIDLNNVSRPLYFLFVDSADHDTGKTGLSPTVTISKNGGGFSAPAGAISELEFGWYQVYPDVDDADFSGVLLLHATGSGADDTDDRYFVGTAAGIPLNNATYVIPFLMLDATDHRTGKTGLSPSVLMMRNGALSVATALDGGIDDTVTTLDVLDATGFPGHGGFRIQIESEIILCGAAPSGTTLASLTRGYEGTTPASHLDTTPVTLLTFEVPQGAISEIGNGWYGIAPSSTDANTLGPLRIHAEASGADPTDDEYSVVDTSDVDGGGGGGGTINATVTESVGNPFMAERYDLTLYEGDTDIAAVKVTHGLCGSDVLLTEISTITMDLCNEDTGLTINSRTAQNVKNANNGTYVDGEFSWAIQPLDTALQDATLSEEWHKAQVTIVLIDGQVRTAAIFLKIIAKPC
jgi:hypothetical protein